MRRDQTLWGSRLLPIVVAGFVGFVIGGWSASFPRHDGLSAAQAVALRFPENQGDDAAAVTVPPATRAAGRIQLASAMDDAALLSPEPMATVAKAVRPSAQQAAPQPASLQSTSGPAPAAATATERPAPPQHAAAVTLPTQTIQAKALAVARKRAERPGYMLNDAQIASIKERLHLTPDQEQMWPAVEAALRNLAYAKAREARAHAANGYQLASADPNSTQVQDLKSAAIPLLMSFNSEQKDEVRNLAHVMGLDQLAHQF